MSFHTQEPPAPPGALQDNDDMTAPSKTDRAPGAGRAPLSPFTSQLALDNAGFYQPAVAPRVER